MPIYNIQVYSSILNSNNIFKEKAYLNKMAEAAESEGSSEEHESLEDKVADKLHQKKLVKENTG